MALRGSLPLGFLILVSGQVAANEQPAALTPQEQALVRRAIGGRPEERAKALDELRQWPATPERVRQVEEVIRSGRSYEPVTKTRQTVAVVTGDKQKVNVLMQLPAGYDPAWRYRLLVAIGGRPPPNNQGAASRAKALLALWSKPVDQAGWIVAAVEDTVSVRLPGKDGPRKMAEMLKCFDYPHVYDEEPNRGHEGFAEKYPQVLKWLAERPRPAFPREIVRLPHAGIVLPDKRFYWLEGDTYQAAFTAKVAVNNIEVQAARVRRLTFHLSDRLLNLGVPVVIRVNGLVVHDKVIPRSVITAVQDAALLNDTEQFATARLTVDVPDIATGEKWLGSLTGERPVLLIVADLFVLVGISGRGYHKPADRLPARNIPGELMTRIDLLSRRQMLRTSGSGLLAAGLWPGVLRADDADAGESFHFVVLNDLHFLDKKCTAWHEGVVQQIKAHQEKPAFCLIVGDLTENGTAEQLDTVRSIYRGLGLPLHVVIGNHDWQTDKDRKAYDDRFPKSTNYTFEYGGYQFVGLDSSDGTKAKVAVQDHTLKWLDEAVPRLDKKKPLILFTHFPLGPMVNYRLTNADDVLERFKGHNLQTVFNGHFHASTERKVGDVTLTTNRCCSFSRNNHDGTKEKGYFLCQVKDGKVTRMFIEYQRA